MITKIKEYFLDSVKTIGPVVLVVLLLSLFIPINNSFLGSFLLSAFLLIIGSILFTYGADLSMHQLRPLMSPHLFPHFDFCKLMRYYESERG